MYNVTMCWPGLECIATSDVLCPTYNVGHDRNENGNNRFHNRQGNGGNERGQKEYYNGPNNQSPDYLPPSHIPNPAVPNMFFGSYPVPPPPPYMGMGMSPINIPSMQIISSYPIVMNTQTGVMQWASPHPHGHGPGSMPVMHPGQGQGQGSMRSHTVGNGTPNQQYLRPRTRSNPQTPRESASYNQGGPNGSFKSSRHRGMSFTGSPLGMSYPSTPPGMGPQGMYFSQQYVLNDGMNMNMGGVNMNYRYQNPNQSQSQNGLNEYVSSYAYHSGSPRNPRNGSSKYQNRFPNVPQNQHGSPVLQYSRKHGSQHQGQGQGQENNQYQNYDDKYSNNTSNNGNGSGSGNGKKNSSGNLSQR
jgi:hypothetical protein